MQEVEDGTHCAYEGMVSIGVDGTQFFWGPPGVFARRATRLNTAIAAAVNLIGLAFFQSLQKSLNRSGASAVYLTVEAIDLWPR